MERVSFVLHIDPQDQAQYIERHQAVYPELLQAFGEVGIHTYSIFLHEGTLFAYMEVDHYQKAMDQLAAHPANQRWQQFMGDMLITNRQGTTSEVIPEVFHYHS